MRILLGVLIVGLCNCSSSYLVRYNPTAFEELNEELQGENVDVVLSSGKEVFGTYQLLTSEQLYVSYSSNSSLEAIPINDIQKITSRNHALGAIEGIGYGVAGGFIGGLVLHMLQGAPEGLGGIPSFLVMVSGPTIGLIVGAIKGHEYQYRLK